MNLHTTIDLDLKGFFQWWGGELAFLVPKKLRQALRDRSGTLVLTAADQGFDADFYRDEDATQAVRHRLDPAETDGLQTFKTQHPTLEKADVVLRLTDGQALHKVLFLPAAVEENLHQVVAFELDRYTPFKAEQVYFSTVTLGKTEHGQLRVLLVLTPRVLLDEQLTVLQGLDIHPQRVDYGSAVRDFPQSLNAYNLLPDRYRPRDNKLRQSVHWLLNGLLLLLVCGLLVWPVWMEARAVDSLKARLKTLESQTRVVEAQQQEIDALHAETQKLIDTKAQTPALLAVLNELSTLLNDETWLTHLQYSDKHLQIQGQSPAASALISVLESSNFFSNVSFVSPLTQDKTTGRERFQISMDVSMPVIEASEASENTEAADETTDDAGGEGEATEDASNE